VHAALRRSRFATLGRSGLRGIWERANPFRDAELGELGDDAEVFKALGPVLVKMELEDAKATVKQRLERLEGEVKRLDEAFKTKNDEKEKLRVSIVKLQEGIRAAQTKGAAEEE